MFQISKKIGLLGNLFLSISFLTTSCLNFKDREQAKVEEEVQIKYDFLSGVLGQPVDTTIKKYNKYGFLTEEITFSLKKNYKYDKDALLISESIYNQLEDKIVYKKIITYDTKSRKEFIKVYQRINKDEKPELVGGMKILYDIKGVIVEKKFFGILKYDEEEGPIFTRFPEDRSRNEREMERLSDSSSAKYQRNSKEKISKIYFNNDTAQKIVFQYDKNGKLILKEHQNTIYNPLRFLSKNSFTGIKYFYENDKLVRVSKYEDNALLDSFIYNNKNKIVERQFKDQNSMFKLKFKYDDLGFVEEEILYDYIEEPIYIIKHKYKFY